MTIRRDSDSTSSMRSNYQPFDSAEENSLQIYSKQKLKTLIFSGVYKERRYVEKISDYRDVVVVDASEKDSKVILEDIYCRLSYYYYQNPNGPWIGITNSGPGSNIYIWTQIKNLPYGHYWFQIKTIQFHDKEIIIKLKPLREVTNENITSVGSSNDSSTGQTNDLDMEYLQNLFISWGNTIKQTIADFLETDLTKENIISALKFMMLLLVSLSCGLIEAIKFLGGFTIKFMTEFRLFLRTSTPLFIKILDIFSKIVGGFYVLIAMLWRDIFGSLVGRPQPERAAPMQAIDFGGASNRNSRYQGARYTDGSSYYRESNRRRFQNS